MEFERPRGTRDFLFDEMKERKEVEKVLRKNFESYAFREIKTPLFEDLKLFTTKSGDEIVDQLYNFKDKSDRDITLRPEITAPVARLYLNELSMTAKPIKLYYYGSCFRYERPQKGRFRQFWQFGCELIGAKSPQGEAEVISLCNKALSNLNINAEININHLGIIRGLFQHFQISDETQTEIITIIDKGDKDLLKNSLTGPDSLIKDEVLSEKLLKLIDIVGTCEILGDIEDLIKDYPECKDSFNQLKELTEILDAYNVDNYKLNLAVARGLDYYTGIVFEVYVPSLGAQKQVCGGGTYSLVKLFGGEEVESTGFAFGFDRLVNALKELNIPINTEKSYIDAYVLPINKDTYLDAFNIVDKLRSEDVRCEIELFNRKFKKSLNFANKLNAPYLVIVGKRELDEGKVTIKNMETGNQEEVPIEDMVKTIKGE